jgi:hypothetical protein
MKMSVTPNGIKTACGLGLLGGVFSVACLALFYKPEDNILPTIAFYMLTAALFFALAGAFVKNSQWNWRVALFVSFINLGIIAGCMAAGYFELWAGIVLLIFDVCIVILETLPSSKKWLNSKL